ncbi:MAG: histidinol dehydrogenase [bacterium]|nr:histidinol dehydrogenase [bacterium]
MRILNYSVTKERNWLLQLLRPRRSVDDTTIRTVQRIINDVRREKDIALIKYTKRFDGAQLTPGTLRVTTKELNLCYENVTGQFIRATEFAIKNITAFHKKQLRHTWSYKPQPGIELGQIFQPIENIGVYVPGGTAPLVSSLLMCVIPAQVAGCSRIAVTTPPDKFGNINPFLLVAADLLRLDEIYKVGGAQAIAALAYGTETIPAVDKIVGPGNKYVTIAKKLVFGTVDIDSLAGPSEIMIIADETADAKYIAADMLSQAEHQFDSRAVLVTDSAELAESVKVQLRRTVRKLNRSKYALHSLQYYSGIAVVLNLEQAVELANYMAPEHLEIMTREPEKLLAKIKHAGAIFLGKYTPEPIGDYIAGPNHVLPTGGTARFSSGLNVDEFLKRSNYMKYSKEALRNSAKYALELAEIEGLDAHAKSIQIRLQELIQ